MKKSKTIAVVISALIIALGAFGLAACKKECKHGKLTHHELQPATCIATGVEKYWECSDCGKLFSDENASTVIEEIPVTEKAEHSWKTTFEKDADGHWLMCSVCSATTEHKAHIEAVTEETDSTCVTNGKTEGKICSLCDYILVAPQDKELLPHAMSHTEAKSADCLHEGNEEYWYCSTCKIYYTDEDGENASSLEELTVAVDPDAHSFGAWVAEVPSGCGTDGVKAHKDCTICEKHFDNRDNEITDLVIQGTAHSFTTVTITAQPAKTTYEVGEKLDKTGLAVTAHCSNCNADVTDAEIIIENENKSLVKGANEFTVKVGGASTILTVYAYESIVVSGNVDIMATETTASINITEINVEGNITAIETAGQTLTQGFSTGGGTLTLNNSVISAMKGSKTYGDFEVVLITDASERYELTVSAVTKKISSLAELNAVKNDTSGNKLDGYYILTQNINANNQSVEAFCDYTTDPAKGLQGIFDGRGFAIINPVLSDSGIIRSVGQNGIVRNLAVIGATGGRVLGGEIHGGTFLNIYVEGAEQYLMDTAWHSPTFENIVFVSSDPDASIAKEGSTGTLTLKNIMVVGSKVFGYWGATKNEVNAESFASVDALKAAIASGTVVFGAFDSDMWTLYNNYPVIKKADAVYKTLAITNTDTNILVGDSLQLTANINGAKFALKEAKTGITVLESGLVSVVGLNGTGEFAVTVTVGGYSAEKTFTYEKTMEIVTVNGYIANLEAGASSETVDLSGVAGTVNKIQVIDGAEITTGFTQSGNTLTVDASVIGAIKGSDSYGDYNVQIFTQESNGNKYRYDTKISVVTKKISTLTELNSIKSDSNNVLDGYYILTQNIDANNQSVEAFCDYTNDPAKGLQGIFDGRGFAIINPVLSDSGIIRSVGQNGIVRNLAVIGATGGRVLGGEIHGGTFQNIYVEGAEQYLMDTAWHSPTFENIVFVSSNANAAIAREGSTGTLTLKNIMVVGSKVFGYWGATKNEVNTKAFATVEAMLDALEEENTLTAWNSPITYNNGAIYFNGTKVIEKA